MDKERIGVCPIESDAIVRYMLRIAAKRGVLHEGTKECGRGLLPYLPSNYLPDICFEHPLAKEVSPRIALVLDPYDAHYLRYASDGAWPNDAPAPTIPEPTHWNQYVGIVATPDGVHAFTHVADAQAGDVCLAQGLLSSAPEHVAEPLRQLASLPVFMHVRKDEGRFELVVLLQRAGMQERFANNPHRAEFVDLLRRLGADEARLSALDKVSGMFGVPYYSSAHGYQEHVVLLDVSHFSFAWEGADLVEARAGIIASDKVMGYARRSFKPVIAYQWHITDECDQRCKHCYLFGEDARMACVTTPWDQLVSTLDQIEERCALAHAYPMLALSGGDPILHPRFWDFAELLRRRGISWTVMGNPFYLDADVCRRLRQLGCFQYQMSLDGLEAFHDRLRKPGSYQATLAALEPLQEAGIKTQLMATASRQNLDDILACMDVAASRGVDSFAFARYCATSPQKARELYPTPQEYRAFLLSYWDKRQAYERGGCKTTFKTKDHLFTLLRWELGEFVVPAWSKARPDRVRGGCHLGAKVTICSNGDLLACRRMPSKVGNVRFDKIIDVERGDGIRRFAQVDGIKGCKDCELLMWCRGCRAVGYNATGDLQAADPMCWKQATEA